MCKGVSSLKGSRRPKKKSEIEKDKTYEGSSNKKPVIIKRQVSVLSNGRQRIVSHSGITGGVSVVSQSYGAGSEQSWSESMNMNMSKSENVMSRKKNKHYVSKDQTKLSFNFIGHSEDAEGLSSPSSRKNLSRSKFQKKECKEEEKVSESEDNVQ